MNTQTLTVHETARVNEFTDRQAQLKGGMSAPVHHAQLSRSEDGWRERHNNKPVVVTHTKYKEVH